MDSEYITRVEHDEFCKRIDEHHEHIDSEIGEIKGDLDDICKDIRTVEHEMREFNQKFQNNVNKMCQSITELTGDVHNSMRMQDEMRDHMRENEKRVGERLEKLEHSGGDTAKKVVWLVVSGILGAMVTAFCAGVLHIG